MAAIFDLHHRVVDSKTSGKKNTNQKKQKQMLDPLKST